MHRPAPRVITWLRHVAAWWAATTAVLLTAALLLGASPAPAAAQAPTPIEYDILAPTAEEMANVRPGDVVDVRIQAPPKTQALEPHFCPVDVPDDPQDLNAYKTICQLASYTPAYSGFYGNPEGLIEFRVTIPLEGSEVVKGPPPTAPAGTPPLLSCGVGDACRLALTLTGFDEATRSFSYSRLFSDPELVFTPQPSAAFEGCAFPTEGALDALGPARLTRASVAWARDRCLGASAPVDLQYTGLGDSEARDLVRSGDGNVFFGSGGVTTEVFPPESGTTLPERPTVSVPVAMNAAVVAYVGSYGVPFPDDANYVEPRTMANVTLTADELAVILSHGESVLITGPDELRRSYGDDTIPDLGAGYESLERNPEIARLAGARTVDIGASAIPEPSTRAVSRYLENRAPRYWSYPADANQPAGQPIGAVTALQSLAFVGGDLSLFSNLNGLLDFVDDKSIATCNTPVNGCLVYVLTDAATAASLELSVVRIQNSNGEFVAPTADSLAIAADGMETASDGTLVAAPADVTAGTYPLPMVEYANFAADLCGPVQATAKNLARYLITRGQDPALLGAGLLPLPEALRDDAEAAVATLEALPDTACPDPFAPAAQPPAAPAPQPPAPAPAPAPAAGTGGTGGGTGGNRTATTGGTGGRSAANSTASPAPAAAAPPTQPQAETPRVPAVEDRAQARAVAAEIDIPAFSGAARMGLAPSLAALALLAALPAGTASAGANWTPARPSATQRLRRPRRG